jgi:hypothetical protein
MLELMRFKRALGAECLSGTEPCRSGTDLKTTKPP